MSAGGTIDSLLVVPLMLLLIWLAAPSLVVAASQMAVRADLRRSECGRCSLRIMTSLTSALRRLDDRAKGQIAWRGHRARGVRDACACREVPRCHPRADAAAGRPHQRGRRAAARCELDRAAGSLRRGPGHGR